MSKRQCQLLIRTIFFTGSLLIGIVLAEVFMCFTGFDYALVWEPDPELGWRHIPGACRLWTSEGRGLVKINKVGYRDRERQVAPPPGTFRIAVLGDSITEAVQVNLDQTFCYLLEERLQKSSQRIEVLNFGVNGYSPIQELLLFKQKVPRYRPNLVIWVAYLDNDISGVHPDLSVSPDGPFVTFDDRGAIHVDYSRAEQSFESYHREPIYSLRKYSCIYRLISTWRWRRKSANQQAQVLRQKEIPKRFLFYQTPLQPKWEEAWITFEQVALEFIAEARRQQVHFIILSAPAAQVVDNRAWQNILNTWPVMANDIKWDLEGPERRLRDFAREHDIVLIQPYKSFRQALKEQASKDLFFDKAGGHMTQHGHQLMAKILEDFLVQAMDKL